jgi:hypothetical protein
MAKTLSQIRTHVRTYLDEVSQADWTDTQIDREINFAYMEMYAAVIETYEDYYRTKQSANVVANQQEYALPTNFYKMRRAEIKYASTDSERRKVTPYNFDQNRRQLDSTNYGSTGIPLADLSGNFIRFLPVPTEDVTEGILITYIRQATELEETSDTIDIPFPDRYAKYIAIGAAGELLRKGQQEETVASRYDDKFAIGLEKMKQELENRYADGNKMILDMVGDWNDFSNAPAATAIYI